MPHTLAPFTLPAKAGEVGYLLDQDSFPLAELPTESPE